MNMTQHNIDFDFLNLQTPCRVPVKVLKTYRIGNQIGVVYSVNGVRCSTIVAKRHMVLGRPRMSRVFRAMDMTPTNREYVSYAGSLRLVSTSRSIKR
jgi:hypothetical protein